ncbi:MAG: serine hydrolase domain-containing protein [Fimbriimonas sp.]
MILTALALLSTPADIDPGALQRLVRRCQESQSWGLVVLQDGKPVVDRNIGRPPCNLMSATKSVTSMAVGILLGEGKLKVDTKVASLFPEYKGKWKDRVTIRHLLEHTSGIQLYQGEGPDALPMFRVPSALADRRYPSHEKLTVDLARTLGGDPVFERYFDRIAPVSGLTANAPDAEFGTGYFAMGWGGQYILVLPKARLVAVRTCGDGLFGTKDSSKYEMGDFYDLARSLPGNKATLTER